jgi:hypothetical protein
MHFLALFLLQDSVNSNMVTGIIAAYLAFFAIIFAVSVVLVMVPTWFICKKAGLSPWLSLLCLLPSLGLLVLLYVLAFADWPSQRVAPQLAYAPPAPPLPPQASA